MEKRIRSIDILSGLPEEVLCHILSFLPTKTSVSTSVLARRWRFLWTHVPNLEFHKSPLRGNRLPLNAINRVIMLHEAKIVNTFSLSNVNVCAFTLETWIIYLIKRSVRNLYLDFGFKNRGDIVYTLPRLLLTCKTLVDLKLVNCGVIPSSGEMFLPILKKLNLTYVQYEDDESLPHLLSGCPVLEELTINDIFKQQQKNTGCIIIVSSPTIKTLNVEFTLRNNQNLEEMLIIDVPALVYLKVDYCDLGRFKSLRKTMNSLIVAEFAFNGFRHRCGIHCNGHALWLEFLSCLCHVKLLKITNVSNDMIVPLVGTTGSTPTFVNLTKLEIDATVDWYNVVKFLEGADNLEVLIINVFQMARYKESKRVPSCMLSRLKTVTMVYFNAFDDDCDDALDTVRYILRNALVLERMEINPNDSNKEKSLDALRKISLFERGSKSCQVAFNQFKSPAT